MRLLVTDCPSDDISLGVMQMSSAEFNDVRCHLFILSHDFDEVVVDLTDKVQLGLLPKLAGRTKVIPKVEGDPSSHVISLLCELYPEQSARLRYEFMRNRAGVVDIVDELRRDNHWSDFY